MSITNDYNIAIIGPLGTVSGFRALGVDAFAADDAMAALEQLREIKRMTTSAEAQKRYAVVLIIEELIAGVDQAEYAKVVEGPLPAVVPLPGPEGSTGFALNRLRALAEKAVGSSII
jgi:V/A-type H+-transporting ATPase subunit F